MSDESPPSSGLPERLDASIFGILGERNFRWLWIGEGVSTLGTQFYLIALPWLVLKLTGSTFTLGSVMGLAGVPRALLLLVGGALTDRFSPRKLMLASNVARLALVILLAVLVLIGQTQLWILYTLAFLFGLADAFFYPALFAIMPQILDRQHLYAGNAIVQGVSQLSIAAGPVLAGVMIALVGGTSADAQSPPARRQTPRSRCAWKATRWLSRSMPAPSQSRSSHCSCIQTRETAGPSRRSQSARHVVVHQRRLESMSGTTGRCAPYSASRPP